MKHLQPVIKLLQFVHTGSKRFTTTRNCSYRIYAHIYFYFVVYLFERLDTGTAGSNSTRIVIGTCIHGSSRGIESRLKIRRGSTFDRLLVVRVQIPPEAWVSVSCECVCCQVVVSSTGRSPVQSSATSGGVSLRVIYKS